MKEAEPLPWKNYFERTKGKPPRPELVKALAFVKSKNNALDLGSGALNDTMYLLSQGFMHVTAVDKVAVANEIAKTLPVDRFEYVTSTFEDFVFPKEKFDLVNAQYALPFIAPDQFKRVFGDIFESMMSGAVLTGQFFGDRDEWKNDKAMTFHTKLESQETLKCFNVHEFREEEQDKKTAAGHMKHWHVFHFVVSKN